MCKSICTLLLLFFINITSAQCVPSFGSASNFTLYTVSGAVGNTGLSTISGNIGTNLGAVTGFGVPSVVNGTTHIADSNTSNAASDLISAYNQLNNIATTNINHAPVFGLNETITSGVYSIGGAGSAVGNLIIDAQNNANAIFIFKFNGAFTTSAGATITLINGANAVNIFWLAEGAIAMAAGTTIYGTLIANNGAISMGNQGNLHGRMYSTTGAVSVYGTTATNVGSATETVISGIISSDQIICSGAIPTDLVLTGSAGIVSKWQKAYEPTFISPIDIVSNSTTLSGNSIGAVIETTYVRVIIQNNGCSNNTAISTPIVLTVISTLWNGTSWSNGLPTDSKSVVISANFTPTGNFTACNLHVTNGANFIMLAGNTVFLNGALTVDNGSSFTLKNNANLIQTSTVQNSGNIQVEKTTSELNRLDYILWSSPVSDQLLQAFSPSTMASRFYSYNPISNLYNVITSPSTTLFSVGFSFLIRLPNNHPIVPTVWDGAFLGTPNNGTVNLSVTNGTYNAVGNPYPSGIDANSFMLQNNINEAMYFWRKTNNANTSSYAAYTLAGGISNSSGDPLHLAPGTIISVGQGFIVKTSTNSITFNNSMRVADINSPLLKLANTKSRIWLDISATNGYFGQQMIAYMNDATIGIDNAIDGPFFNDIQTGFTSIIDNKEFSIQGRPLPFSANDVVALGFKSNVANTYTISLNHFDGLFTNGQDIYLRDITNGIITDLKAGNYTFTTLAGVFNSRFELLYQSQLSNPQQNSNANQIIIYNQNSNLTINSGNKLMSKIKIYDITGRVLVDKENINNTEFKIAMNTKNNIYIVQVTSIDNQITTQKIIN